MVTPSFFPVLGGLELYVFNISRELVKRGHEVHVYTPQTVMGQKIIPLEQELDGVHIHRLAVTLNLSYRARFCYSLVPRLIDDSIALDLVHIQGHDHIQSLLAFLLSKLRKLTTVISTYGPIIAQTEYSTKKRPFFEFYDSFLTPIMLHYADLVIAKFPSIIPWVERKRNGPGGIGSSPSGIPREFLVQAEGNYLQEKLTITGPVILYVGRISAQKGVQHLISAMPGVLRNIPEARLVIVGPDYSNFKSALIEAARDLGVDNHVSFVGPVYDSREEVRMYASCDVFVMPSSFEGFSQAIHKAWAQGKPVVATRVGSLSDEIESGRNGLLVEYGDSEALAKALVQILSSPDLASLYGASGRKKAANYTYDILAAEIEKLYVEVLRSRSSTVYSE